MERGTQHWSERQDVDFESKRHVLEPVNVLDYYMADISKYPLLKREQEIDLAKKISGGDDAAKETLCNSNLRLVVRIAKCYKGSDFHLGDLIQMGNLGLLKAADRYDPDMGTRFSSYASLWISAYIVNGIKETGREIRIPVDRLNKIQELNKLRTDLYAELDRDPKEGELAEASGISVKEIRGLFTTPEVTESLDREISWGDETIPVGEIIEDPDQNVVEQVEADNLKTRIIDLIDSLPSERNREILKLRYGLKDGHLYSYKEIQETFPDVTVQRLQQVVTKSIESLYKVAGKMDLDQ
jgi:RNA polymerase primary sigma factor